MTARGTRADRIAETMRRHPANPAKRGTCRCGFIPSEGDSHEDHVARLINARLFGLNPHRKDILGTDLHRPGPDNISIHRALGEPLCDACQDFLERITA